MENDVYCSIKTLVWFVTKCCYHAVFNEKSAWGTGRIISGEVKLSESRYMLSLISEANEFTSSASFFFVFLATVYGCD